MNLRVYFRDYSSREGRTHCYGHPQGDHCLIEIAQTAKQTVGRSSDLVARIGGEEFAVILPNTNLEGAKVAAENIRLAIESLKIPHQDSQINHQVTISLGIMSVVPKSGQSPTTLINQADQALLEAKRRGKNQSVTFSLGKML
ncbi:MAG: diguanylate cyclase [Snowella sp.]